MTFLLFLAAASVIALSPGPGILYVAARTLADGRQVGLASSFGTGVGGLVHVAAGAIGVSALVMASAEAFTLLKIAGALYLVWLGIKTARQARRDIAVARTGASPRQAFREGVVVEALNPKTAAFFLAFLPQFVDPASGSVWLQFLLLGLISVTLNTAVDVVVAFVAARARAVALTRPTLLSRLRQGAGGLIASLGLLLLFARRPASV
ncbi:MAG: LysE family translocator [Enhydrobacter sp.]|nr:MAG: LysE family translocator [Enhydrobacter sp.]